VDRLGGPPLVSHDEHLGVTPLVDVRAPRRRLDLDSERAVELIRPECRLDLDAGDAVGTGSSGGDPVEPCGPTADDNRRVRDAVAVGIDDATSIVCVPAVVTSGSGRTSTSVAARPSMSLIIPIMTLRLATPTTRAITSLTGSPSMARRSARNDRTRVCGRNSGIYPMAAVSRINRRAC